FHVTGVKTCALPICGPRRRPRPIDVPPDARRALAPRPRRRHAPHRLEEGRTMSIPRSILQPGTLGDLDLRLVDGSVPDDLAGEEIGRASCRERRELE